MAEEIEFTEVESGNSGPETGLPVPEETEAEYEPGEMVHVYLVFDEETSIEEGIRLVEQQVLSGSKLDVRREDTTGNAVVAVMTREQQQQAEKLPEVESAEIDEAAELQETSGTETNGSLPDTTEIITDTTKIEEATEMDNTEATMQKPDQKPIEQADSRGYGGLVVVAVLVLAVVAVFLGRRKKRS